MQSILTLTVGEFELVHDLFSLLIAAMGAATLFFLLSRKQVAVRFQPLLLLAGIVTMIGCYHAMRLFYSWNEAFELAGNSYAASGHFFHELYRYSDWVLTMPLLLIELALAAGWEKQGPLLKRLIMAALISVAFAYLGASNFGDHGALVRWACWVLELIPFLYIAQLLMQQPVLTLEGLQVSQGKFFSQAKALFLLSWAFYPLVTFVALCNHGLGERGLIIFLAGTSIADFFSKCGVSFYIYRIGLISEREE